MTTSFDPIDADARRVELATVEVQPSGEAFVLGFADADRALLRVELPRWAVHQLMRVLPRLDAALAQARGEPPEPAAEISPINRVRSARQARSAVASTRR